MIVLGLVLLVLGLLLGIHLLPVLGINLAVIGAVLAVAGGSGRSIGGRSHWWYSFGSVLGSDVR